MNLNSFPPQTKFLAPLLGRVTVFTHFSTKRFFFFVAGYRFENRKTSTVETYKWSWASTLENRDRLPSILPRKCDFGHVSAARLSWLLTTFFPGCLHCKNLLAGIIVFLVCHHQNSANKLTVKSLLKVKNLFRYLHLRARVFTIPLL